jgi:plastocyanin
LTALIRYNNTERPLTILAGASVQGSPNFDPDTITVKKGDKIIVTNKDTLPHTVTSGTGPSDPNAGKQFDTSIIQARATADIDTHNANLGQYPFHCTVHPYMTGKLIVTDRFVPAITAPSFVVTTNATTPSVTTNATTHPTNLTYLPYSDTDLDFTIQYPSDWTIDKENTAYSTVAGFDSPNKTGKVAVRVFPSSDYKSIKEYGDKNFKESKDYTLLAYYRNSTTLLSGKPAMKAIYLTTNPGLFGSSTSKAMMVATMVPEKNSIYAIVYFSNPQNFNDFRPVIEKMIDSFKISGKGPVIQEDNSSSSVN